MLSYYGTSRRKGREFHFQYNYDYDTDAKNPHFAGLSQTDWRQQRTDYVKGLVDFETVDFVACIFHDRCNKPLHMHCVISFEQSQDLDKVTDALGVSSRFNCEVLADPYSMLQYLTHTSWGARNEGKVEYAYTDVMVFGKRTYKEIMQPKFWLKSDARKVTEEQAEKIADTLGYDIYNGDLSYDDAKEAFIQRAGYGFIRMSKFAESFKRDRDNMKEQKILKMRENGRDLVVDYICGTGGSAKTTTANAVGRHFIAKSGSRQGTVYNASVGGRNKTPDPFGKYRDEPVVIMNEVNHNSFTYDEFNNSFDPYNYSPISSRGDDSDCIADVMTMTNSVHPLRFAKDLLLYSPGGSAFQSPGNPQELNDNPETLDKFWQIKRRMRHITILLRDDNDLSLYHGHVFNLYDDPINGGHFYAGSYSYVNAVGQAPVIDDDVLSEIDRLRGLDAVTLKQQGAETLEAFSDRLNLYTQLTPTELVTFIEDVVNKSSWDLIPVKFLYDLYKKYLADDYPGMKPMNRNQFTALMTKLLSDDFDYGRHRSGGRMDADEPLITIYGLDVKQPDGRYLEWANINYKGDNETKRRDFRRSEKYVGFLRK